MEIRYALVKELPEMEYDDAVARATELLADEGFGVLTEIDVKATLKKKLDVDFKRYDEWRAVHRRPAAVQCRRHGARGRRHDRLGLQTHRRLFAGRQSRRRPDRGRGRGQTASSSRQVGLRIPTRRVISYQ